MSIIQALWLLLMKILWHSKFHDFVWRGRKKLLKINILGGVCYQIIELVALLCTYLLTRIKIVSLVEIIGIILASF